MAKSISERYHEVCWNYAPDSFDLSFSIETWQKFLKEIPAELRRAMNEKFYFHVVDQDLVPDNWDEVPVPEEAYTDLDVDELMFHGVQGAEIPIGWLCWKGTSTGVFKSDLDKLARDLS